MLHKARWKARLIRRHFSVLSLSLIALIVIRVVLATSSYRTALRLIEKAPPRRLPDIPVIVIVWAVRHTARLVPRASCLTQALAVRYLLSRIGESCVIRVGMAEGGKRPLDAHAWVIHEGRVLIGGETEEISRFTPLVDL
ncbi:lasso peptide biosynthesis B2 protein [Croceibacterium atlanticum]|uniref:lasso peptide biosynthesis B2 protein n=1 Tax=Croceibacterium atlanticum TaxID=1267766 RepID=UPI0006B2FD11|nr:lasso peptide biosynthesis B2 protein [Croceibacterium atlanticum]